MSVDTLTLGEWISDIYEHFLSRGYDPELAAVATAATVNDLLASRHALA